MRQAAPLHGGGGARWEGPHLHQLEGEALVKDAVDLCPSGQVGRVDLIPRAFDALLKVHRKLLHHPAQGSPGSCRPADTSARVCVCVN